MDKPVGDSIDVQLLSDAELIKMRAALNVEMQKRNISFSVGDIGEEAAIAYFKRTADLPNLQRAPTGTKNVDALSRHGNRYSIKSVCRGSKTGTIYPDSDDQDRTLFERLLIVQLSGDLELKRIVEFTWEEFCDVRCWDKRMNAWYVPITKRVLSSGTVLHADRDD